jgi:hypothetical protein
MSMARATFQGAWGTTPLLESTNTAYGTREPSITSAWIFVQFRAFFTSQNFSKTFYTHSSYRQHSYMHSTGISHSEKVHKGIVYAFHTDQVHTEKYCSTCPQWSRKAARRFLAFQKIVERKTNAKYKGFATLTNNHRAHVVCMCVCLWKGGVLPLRAYQGGCGDEWAAGQASTCFTSMTRRRQREHC